MLVIDASEIQKIWDRCATSSQASKHPERRANHRHWRRRPSCETSGQRVAQLAVDLQPCTFAILCRSVADWWRARSVLRTEEAMLQPKQW